MELSTMIVGGLITLAVSILNAVLIRKYNKTSDDVERLQESVTILQQIAVTDSHVRKIVKEELQPIAANSEKMLISMHNIELYISEEKGRKAAILEAQQRRVTD